MKKYNFLQKFRHHERRANQNSNVTKGQKQYSNAWLTGVHDSVADKQGYANGKAIKEVEKKRKKTIADIAYLRGVKAERKRR